MVYSLFYWVIIIPRNRGRGSGTEKRVAANLRKAGFKVHRNVRSRAGEIDIIARRGGRKYVYEVKGGGSPVTSTDVRELYRKAQYHKANPVLALSKERRLTDSARKLVRRLGIRIRRI